VRLIGYLATLLAIILPLAGLAQEQADAPAKQSIQAAQPSVKDFGDFQLDRWVYDEKVTSISDSEKFSGSKELLQTRVRGTVAYPKNFQFRDGVIECDMAGGFYLGISFRIVEVEGERFSEDIYFRVEGNERPKTVQYYPHGKLGQRDLHRPPYEQAIRLIKQDEWFHVRVEVQGRQARVFLDNEKEPVQVIEDLMHDHAVGSVGVRSWGGRFANLKVAHTKPATDSGK
jgi:hypothetical protein